MNWNISKIINISRIQHEKYNFGDYDMAPFRARASDISTELIAEFYLTHLLKTQ